MKVAVIILAVFAVSSAEEKEKRGAVGYSTPRNYQIEGSQDVAYATARVSPQTFSQAKEASYSQPQYQTVKYTTQQQASPVAYQQPYDYEQAYQGQQQTVTKLAPAKVAYASAPAPASAPSHYSLASDVSSFSYNSPIVKYSNLGVLSQTLGKLASPQSQQQLEYTSASSQQSSPQVQYTAQKDAYSFPLQQQQQQPQKKIVYSSEPQQQYSYSLAPQPKLAYTTVPQKVNYAAAPQQIEYTKAAPQIQYSKPQQQIAYITAGQKQQQQQQQQAYQYIPQSQLQAYVSSAQHQQPQEQQQQQQQYVYAQAPQGYEKAYSQQHYTGAQSNPLPAYVAPQGQYYSSKAPNTGVRYA